MGRENFHFTFERVDRGKAFRRIDDTSAAKGDDDIRSRGSAERRFSMFEMRGFVDRVDNRSWFTE